MFLEGIISLVTTWYAEYQGTHLVTEAVTIAATIKMTAMNVATIRLYLLVSAMSYSSCYTEIKKNTDNAEYWIIPYFWRQVQFMLSALIYSGEKLFLNYFLAELFVHSLGDYPYLTISYNMKNYFIIFYFYNRVIVVLVKYSWQMTNFEYNCIPLLQVIQRVTSNQFSQMTLDIFTDFCMARIFCP